MAYALLMADKPPEPKQTTPKGVEIPIPARDAVLRDLMKAAPKPDPEPATLRKSTKRD
jgi:hypothetical protein